MFSLTHLGHLIELLGKSIKSMPWIVSTTDMVQEISKIFRQGSALQKIRRLSKSSGMT